MVKMSIFPIYIYIRKTTAVHSRENEEYLSERNPRGRLFAERKIQSRGAIKGVKNFYDRHGS